MFNKIFLLLSLFGLCAISQGAVQITTDAPVNLFDVGKPVVVNFTSDAATVNWTLTDWDEKVLQQGTVTLMDGKGSVTFEGLDYGYYEVSSGSREPGAFMSFAVINDHSAQDPPEGRIAIDGAISWLSPVEDYDELAKGLRAAGVGWVRERASWGEIEPEKGKENYGRYDLSADAYAEQKVRVYQIFHDTAGWARAAGDNTRNPEDLRDIYNFAKRMAQHYKGRVQAWEVWNEPDIGFWPDLADTYSGIMKAAYLGFKAGDPELPVLLGSFCIGYSNFTENVYETGIVDYYDIFNWHTYSTPPNYANILKGFRSMLERYGVEARPIWLSECGIPLPSSASGGEVNAFDEKRQANFVAQSIPSQLAAGTDRHFFFVYPYYLENINQFGSLRKDLSPRPVFIAFATTVDLLGEAKFLGNLNLPEANDCTAYVFNNKGTNVLTIWSSEEQEIKLPVDASEVTVVDPVGRREVIATPDGILTLHVSNSPRYVVGMGSAAVANVSGEVRYAGQMQQTYPSKVVVRSQAQNLKLMKMRNCYMITPGVIELKVETVNLDDAKSAYGEISLEIPEGWSAEPAKVTMTLEPMGREITTFKLTPSLPKRGVFKVHVKPVFANERVAPSVSWFQFDPAGFEPVATQELKLDNPDFWAPNVCNIGKVQIVANPEGGIRAEIEFSGDGDRWCYPVVDFDTPQDYSGWDGISFDLRCKADPAKTSVSLQLYEKNTKAGYICDAFGAKDDWQQAIVLFDDMKWGSFSPGDPNGKLDLNDIASLMIGVNTKEDRMNLEVRNLKLFRIWH